MSHDLAVAVLVAVSVGAAVVGVGVAVVGLTVGEVVGLDFGVVAVPEGAAVVAVDFGAAVVLLALADGFAGALADVGDVACAVGCTGADGAIALLAGPQSSLYVALFEVLAGAPSILISAQPLPALVALTVPLLTGRVAAAMKFSVCTGPGFPDE